MKFRTSNSKFQINSNNRNLKRFVIWCLMFGVFAFALAANAFVGPTTGQTPGSGGGKFNVDSQGSIGFGTASPSPASTFNSTSTESGPSGFGYVFVVASATNPGIGLKNLTSGNTYIWSSRNFGNLQLYRESGTLPGYVVMDINQFGDVAIGQKATSTGGVARLFVGGNVQATGAFVGSLSGSLSAANVSSDVFGRLQGNGNFAFPASLGVAALTQNGLPQSLSVYGGGYFSGSVGIGTTTPTAKLDILTSGTEQANIFTRAPAGIWSYLRVQSGTNLWDVRTNSADQGAAGAAGAFSIGLAGGNAQFVINTSGNVGIGTTSPNLGKLQVNTLGTTPAIFAELPANANAVILQSGVTGGAGAYGWKLMQDEVTTGDLFLKSRIAGVDSTNPVMYFQRSTGNVGIGTTNPITKLEVAGTVSSTAITITTTSTLSGNWQLAGASLGSLNMGAQSFSDITGVDKLTVTTIDPLYNIGGKKYATYVASIVGGVKEEYIGRGRLGDNKEYVLDFDEVSEGSDLWVWRKAVDFSASNIDAFVTPYGEFANIYYEVKGNRIIFHGDKEVEFSYRLIGKRFDWRDHPTFVKDQNEETTLIVK